MREWRLPKLSLETIAWWISLAILGVVGTYTSYKTAITNFYNADAVVDTLIFPNFHQLNNVYVPAQHTFLLKWPFFLLQHLFPITKTNYVILTLFFAIVAYFGIILFIARLIHNRRASTIVTLLFAGIILLEFPIAHWLYAPVNLAMTTTRNIEYVVFFGVLYFLFAGIRRWWHFAIAVTLMALLCVSDQLFIFTSIGAALLLALGGIHKLYRWQYWWVSGGILLGAALGKVALPFVAHFVHISGLHDPVHIVTDPHILRHVAFINFKNIFVDFGVNITEPQPLLSWLLRGLNAIVLLSGICLSIYTLWRFIRGRLASKAEHIAAFLVLYVGAIFTLSILTGQAGERYIYILVPTSLLLIGIYFSQRITALPKNYYVGTLCLLALLLAGGATAATHNQQTAIAYSEQRVGIPNEKIVRLLATHHTSILLGNYWNVVPAAAISQNSLQRPIIPVPVNNCVTAMNYLVRSDWYRPHKADYSAFLLADAHGKEIGDCSETQLIKLFGAPRNKEVLQRDAKGNPTTQLWIYDYDIRTLIDTTPLRF